MRKTVFLAYLLVTIGNAFGQSSKVNLFIDSFVIKNNFNGTILLAKENSAWYKKSFGFANFRQQIPNTTDTRYKIASITKAFTAVLIFQLYEKGKIDLYKTINNYLPDYKGEAANKVTLLQLLNMTSGIHNMDADLTLESALKKGMPQYQLPHTTDEMLTLYSSGKLETEPGKVWDYNNADYIILGKIIERVTGKTFEENLQASILQPLEMANSGIAYQQKIIPRLADTYFYRDDIKALVNDLPAYMENWYASGAMYATADDILRFANALFGKKLLKQATLDLMFTSGLNEYGCGVWVYKDYEIHHRHYTIIKRPGSIMGAQAMLFHVLEKGATIIILSNAATTSLDEFAAKIAEQVVE
ncbi:beta-lactamase family protein [Chitinophaga varians]|uniref:Beta-lactamase family protein n=1 Tax=Chitinophaga varians TaxID=2202339 RepID=A0A847S3E4_9BACT|nr:serine hydrolase domain-containing protein [Chitinophaga varians]NLR67965.1 beta-lactamase family protein [Chitinophaga varians]